MHSITVIFYFNPVMTFPIKKRINAELFIDKTAALYIIKDEHLLRVVLVYLQIKYTVR